MIYAQQVIERQLSFEKSEFSEDIQVYGGISEEKGNSRKIYSRCMSQKNIYFDPLRVPDIVKIKETIRQCEKVLNEYGVELQAFLKIHFEFVEINNVNDTRYYDYLRLVYNKNGYKYVDEIHLKVDYLTKIKESVERNLEYINGKINDDIKPINGNYAAVMGPRASGYFCHEVIGHLLETDNFNYSKCFFCDDRLPVKLNVIDSVKGVEDIIGLNRYDDMGSLLKPIKLICNGKIQNLISLNENSKIDSYGMARRQDYKMKIMPRMRNTILLGEDILPDVQFYNLCQEMIWITDVYAGGVNIINGDYILRGRGWRLVRGEKRNPIDKLVIKGNMVRDLAKIEYIKKDYQLISGECSKIGNIVRVGMTGPSVFFSNIEIQGELYGKY